MTSKSRIGTVLIVTLLALAAAAALLAATRYGIGIDPDSVVYFDAARNLLHGDGLMVFSETSAAAKPLTHFPPLYPVAIALVGTLGIGLASAARWLNAALFGANVLVVGMIIRRYASASFWLPTLGAFLVMSAPDVIGAHSFALSEALFILLTLVGLQCLTSYCARRQRVALILAALAIGLSVLARYIGAANICAGTFVVLFCGRTARNLGESGQPEKSRALFSSNRAGRRKLADAVIFGFVSCAPMGLWAVRNRLIAGRATDHPLVFHPIAPHHLVVALSTVAQWLLFGQIRHDLRAIVFVVEVIAIGLVTFYLLRLRRREGAGIAAASARDLPQILALFIGCYVGLMTFSLSVVDASIVFDSRHLVPVHIAAVVLALCLGHRLYLTLPRIRSVCLLLVVPAVALAIAYGVRGAHWFEVTRHDGQGFASREWRESPTIARVKNLPADIVVYSNGFDAIYYLTGRHAFHIPEETIYLVGAANPKFDLELEQIRDDLRLHGGRVVYFDRFPERTFLPSENDLKAKLHLQLIDRNIDGRIYELEQDRPH